MQPYCLDRENQHFLFGEKHAWNDGHEADECTDEDSAESVIEGRYSESRRNAFGKV